MKPGRIDKPFESYYGGKEFEGGAQNIINEIPPHDVFVELFAGNITITRYIIQAKFTILNDIDPDVIAAIKGLSKSNRVFVYLLYDAQTIHTIN